MKSIYLILIVMFLSDTGIAQEKSTTTLYPWLARSGKFGYCDSAGKNIIKPRFDDAQPFRNGYAIVGENGRYGVIDAAQRTIIPLEYPSAQLFSDGLFDLVITKKGYNAWWRFWQWKFIPEFNILSTSNHGPFLVTKVPKATWTILSIPDKKVLLRQKRMEGKTDNAQYWKKDWYPDQGIPADIQISSSGNSLKVRNKLFLCGADHKLKHVAGHVLELMNDTAALIFKNGKYVKLDITGEVQEKETYVMLDSVQFQVDPGITVDVKKQSEEMYPFPTIAAFILKGADGNTYLSPELSKPLPIHVQDYKRGDVSGTAAEIMKRAITIASLPGTQYFLVVSAFGENNERKCLLLDSNGNWHTNIPAYEGLDQMLNNGDLLFTRGTKKGILTNDLKFKDLPFDYRAYPLPFSKYMYSGKDVVTQKYGIYNTAKQDWQVSPGYSYIGNEIAPGSCIYTEIRKDENGTEREWYGLVDIKTGKVITPSIYNMITHDGRVGVTENGQQIYFYINPITGKEYRE